MRWRSSQDMRLLGTVIFCYCGFAYHGPACLLPQILPFSAEAAVVGHLEVYADERNKLELAWFSELL